MAWRETLRLGVHHRSKERWGGHMEVNIKGIESRVSGDWEGKGGSLNCVAG